MDPKVTKLSFAKVAASSYVPPEVERLVTPQTPPNPHTHVADNLPQDGPPISAEGLTETKNGMPSDDCSIKIASNDDGSTQLSSDDSAKPSFDCKSVASGATFGLDEKESLRPDDSASVRAIDDEYLSAPGSVVAGSRVNSDVGASAFREQLREIAFMNSMPRGHPNYQGPVIVSTAALAQPSAIKPGLISPGSQSMSLGGAPDEKLLEALQSQRDRVWVLKLEQDIIDFIGQSKEATLTLPQCNAFYRMLAHKLADYYKLDHSVDHTATGAAVVITRTAQSRIPPPLSGLPNPGSVSNTPPLIIPARKIMRRPDDPKTSETSTAANSEGPSATTSEVGIDSNGNDSAPPSDLKKSQMTREEREAKYAEVRERIFGKQDEADANEACDENVISRASSTTGRKKNKQRNVSNDDFEPRSQFPHYYPPPQYQANNVQSDQFYYQPYAAPAGQYPVPHAVGQNYSQGYPMMPTDGSYWNPAINAQGPMPVGPYPPGPPNPGYDLSAHFHAGMAFQNDPAGPKMQPPAPYGPVPHWAQNPYDQYQYGRSQYPDQQVGMMQPPYPYSQYPYPYPGTVPANPHQHNGYPRPQFNPQIHPFVPSANHRPAMPNSIPPMPPFYQMPLPMPNGSRSAPPGNPSNRPGFTSPRTTSASTPVPVTAIPDHQAMAGASSASASPPNGPKVPEITAKWGTPSHLPPKPPPPKSLEPLKFHEINRGLPTYPGLPLPRIGGPNGFGNGPANPGSSSGDGSPEKNRVPSLGS